MSKLATCGKVFYQYGTYHIALADLDAEETERAIKALEQAGIQIRRVARTF